MSGASSVSRSTRLDVGRRDALRPRQILERRVHARVEHLPPPERPRQRLDHRVVDPRPRRPRRTPQASPPASARRDGKVWVSELEP